MIISLFPYNFIINTSIHFELWGHLLPNAVVRLVRFVYSHMRNQKLNLIKKLD